METKTLKVHLPIELHREFVKCFPGHGERSAFVRMMVGYAVKMKGQRNCFTELVRRQVEEDLSG